MTSPEEVAELNSSALACDMRAAPPHSDAYCVQKTALKLSTRYSNEKTAFWPGGKFKQHQDFSIEIEDITKT